MCSEEGLFSVCLFMRVSACLCLYLQPVLTAYDSFSASTRTVPKTDQNGSLFTIGSVCESQCVRARALLIC